MKLLYLENAITDYRELLTYYKFFALGVFVLVVFLLICLSTNSFFVIQPIFLLLMTYFWYSLYESNLKKTKQKIYNALEIWHHDLGDDYYRLRNILNNI